MIQLLDLAKGAQTLSQGKDSAILKQLVLLGGSPHGSRPKVLAQFDAASGQLSTLDDVSWGQPWLIKFPAQGEHKEVCAIEHVYTELARHCGLGMPATRHFNLDRRLAAFGVQRFDRENCMRVPVHTLAGMLHVDFRLPSVDYLSDLLRLAADTGVPERQARHVIETTTAQTGLFADLAHSAPIRTATIKAISRAIHANRNRLK